MNNSLSIKEKLYQACEDNIAQRIEMIQKRLDSIKESRTNETKSSVGDKHETGRAMMQLEEEKASYQLSNALESKRVLTGIDSSNTSNSARKGSLIITNQAKYYIAIGIGKVVIDNIIYYCISQDAPIAARLIGKSVGEETEFNGRKITLKEIY